ncbi:MAG: hypothetical protein ACXAC5_15230, partial [Promethearchaeota archaeon]
MPIIFPMAGAVSYKDEITEVIFGRDEEIRKLEEFVHSVKNGRTFIMNLFGIVGSGKSHLGLHFIKKTIKDTRYEDILPVYVATGEMGRTEFATHQLAKQTCLNLLGNHHATKDMILKRIDLEQRKKIKEIMVSIDKNVGTIITGFLSNPADEYGLIKNKYDILINAEMASSRPIKEEEKTEIMIKNIEKAIEEALPAEKRNLFINHLNNMLNTQKTQSMHSNELIYFFAQIREILSNKLILIFWDEVERTLDHMDSDEESKKFLTMLRILINRRTELQNLGFLLVFETHTYNKFREMSRAYDTVYTSIPSMRLGTIKGKQVKEVLEYCRQQMDSEEKNAFSQKILYWLLVGQRGRIRQVMGKAHLWGLSEDAKNASSSSEYEKLFVKTSTDPETESPIFTTRTQIIKATTSKNLMINNIDFTLITLLGLSTEISKQYTGYSDYTTFEKEILIDLNILKNNYEQMTGKKIEEQIIELYNQKGITIIAEKDKIALADDVKTSLITDRGDELVDHRMKLLFQFVGDRDIKDEKISRGIEECLKDIIPGKKIQAKKEIDLDIQNIEKAYVIEFGTKPYTNHPILFIYFNKNVQTLSTEDFQPIKSYLAKEKVSLVTIFGYFQGIPTLKSNIYNETKEFWNFGVEFDDLPSIEMNIRYIDLNEKHSLKSTNFPQNEYSKEDQPIWKFLKYFDPVDLYEGGRLTDNDKSDMSHIGEQLKSQIAKKIKEEIRKA